MADLAPRLPLVNRISRHVQTLFHPVSTLFSRHALSTLAAGTVLTVASLAPLETQAGGVMDQRLTVHALGDTPSSSWSSTEVHAVATPQTQTTSASLAALLASPVGLGFGDGYTAFDFTDGHLNIGHAAGDSARHTRLICGVMLEDANSYFTNLMEVFDTFYDNGNISSSPAGWTASLMDFGGSDRILRLEVNGLLPGDPNVGRTAGASFSFDVVTVAPSGGPAPANPVPEPGTWALAGLGLEAAARRRA